MKKIKEKLLAFMAIPFVKYALVLVIGVVLIGFAGSNSIMGHFQNKAKIEELKVEIEHYEDIYRHDQNQIHQLQSSKKEMERVARERYFMKTADEDIFVLSDDQREYQENNKHHETAE